MDGTPVVKALIYGEETDGSNVAPYAEDERFYGTTGAIAPPYDPMSLCEMFERSSSLRPNVDAMATNIDAFGFRLETAIDLDAADANERIRDSILVEALYDQEAPSITDDAVIARRRELEALARIERLRTNLFFDHCCAEMSFTELRKRTRVDLEVTGNAYWEVLRNPLGEVAQFSYVPSATMRLLRSDDVFTSVEVQHRISPLAFRRVEEKRRFRRYVQMILGQERTYFKEFGDPRWVDSRTGKVFADEATFRKSAGANADPATELIHFKIHSPKSVYGIPRWIGASLAVLGTRDSEEVNLTYFRNKAVPPLAILVSGGVLAAGAADRISTYIRDHIKGKDNFHSILVLEAEGASGGTMTGMQGARVRIEVRNLMEAQAQDALFQNYEANNVEKVGNAFRIPKILRGSMADFNRSTAEAAIRYAEQQVFAPERASIDFFLNERILVDRGVRFLRYVSNSPVEQDPPELVEMATKLVDSAIITPNEGRDIAGDAFNKRFANVTADWARIPPKCAQLGFTPEPTAEEIATGDLPQPPTPPAEAASAAPATPAAEPAAAPVAAAMSPLEETARSLVALRDQLRLFEDRADETALQTARQKEADTVVEVPKEEWNRWFTEGNSAPAAGNPEKSSGEPG